MKEKVASVLAARVSDGDVIGIGSGSTVELAVKKIGERIRSEGLRVSGLATSHRIAEVAASAGISVLASDTVSKISWAFDGADEVDPKHDMIKGRGAAMLHEKIIARKANALVIIVTEEKLVSTLGEKFAVPVEVIPAACNFVKQELLELGAKEVLVRESDGKYGPTFSEEGNVVLDALFSPASAELEDKIKCITGVVESGLFTGFMPEVLVASASGVFSRTLDASGSLQESKVG